MAHIRYTHHTGQVLVHHLDPDHPHRIGKHPLNEVQLVSMRVARHHASVGMTNGAWVLTDLGSAFDTRLNGERVHGEARLAHGDTITLGNVSFEFVDDEGSPRPAG